LYVDKQDTNSYVGVIYYNNNNYEMGGAIKVHDWVFVLERMYTTVREKSAPQNDPNVWVIGAFHDKSHYSFVGVTTPTQIELNNCLARYVVANLFS
jgi:hypothetical protein